MQERLEALQRLLQDPTGNTAALGAAIGIIVLLVIIVVLLLLALALPGRDEQADAEEDPDASRVRRSAKVRARLAALVIVLLASVVAVAAWYQSTSSIRYCTRVCHQMAQPAATWRASSHAGVPCTRCHEGRPWVSFQEGVVGRARSLYLYATDGEGGGRSISADICLDCHRAVLDETVTALNGEIYVHRSDFEDGRRCEDCHGMQGHVKPTQR